MAAEIGVLVALDDEGSLDEAPELQAAARVASATPPMRAALSLISAMVACSLKHSRGGDGSVLVPAAGGLVPPSDDALGDKPDEREGQHAEQRGDDDRGVELIRFEPVAVQVDQGAQAGLALEAMVCEHERDGRAWKTEWLVVPETGMYFAASVTAGARMLDGLRVDADRMLRNIGQHRGYLMSEPVMRALADRLGKHTAHEAVYAAAMNGLDADQDFRAALRADARLDAISDAELDELLEVRASLGSSAAFADRVCRACAGARK